jgi:ABC-type branched-subunit amino acid transport system permease subunit
LGRDSCSFGDVASRFCGKFGDHNYDQMATTIIFALSYNMLLGQAGKISFGHAIYLGFGGFMCIHMMNYLQAADVPIPLPGHLRPLSKVRVSSENYRVNNARAAVAGFVDGNFISHGILLL